MTVKQKEVAVISPLPFSIELNIAVRKVADRLFPCGFDVGPDAPETLEALTAHIDRTGRMLVSDQNCQNTIFGCPEANMAMRAWHDWCHWRGGFAFDLEGEYQAFEVQIEHLKTLGMWSQEIEDLLFIEVVVQATHFELFGEFPEDQRDFTRTALAAFGQDVPKGCDIYADFLRSGKAALAA